MTISSYKEQCIDLIKRFIEKKYDGNESFEQKFSSLKEFPITQLKSEDFQDFGDIQFNRGLRDYFECDDTELVKAILFLFYSSKTEDIELFRHRSGYHSIWLNDVQLTGDTINTFNTLFSTECANSLETNNKVFPKFADKDNELKIKIENFYKEHYQYIGNFILLPCNTYNRRSLNTFRSGYYSSECDFNDYFDQFLIEMKKCLKLLEENRETYEEPTKTFCEIIKQSNGYFKDYLQNDFDEFISFNALESYTDSNNVVKNICGDRYRYSKYRDSEQDEYKKFAENYITKFAQKNIITRSGFIIDAVWEEYKQYF